MITSSAATGSTPTKQQQQQLQQGIRFYKSGSVSPIPPPPPSATVATSRGSISAMEIIAQESPNTTVPAMGGALDQRLSTSYQTHQQQLLLSQAQLPSLSDNDDSCCSAPPHGVDGKLFQIVKHLVTKTPSLLVSSSSSSASGSGSGSSSSKKDVDSSVVDTITSLIIEKHREYQRKDKHWIGNNIQLACCHLNRSSSSSSGSSSSNSNNNHSNNDNSSRKRGRRAMIVAVNQSSDFNNTHDIMISTTTTTTTSPSRCTNITTDTDSIQMESDSGNNNGGMLNASLRNRYRNVNNIASATKVINGVENGAIATILLSEVVHERRRRDDDNADEETSNLMNTTTTAVEAVTPTTMTTTMTTTMPTQQRSSTKKTKKKGTKRKSSATTTTTTPLTTSSSRIMSNGDGMIIQPSLRPTERYSNLGGITQLLTQLRELIEYPLSRPELFIHLGIDPPRGVLLRGPPGCGKTHLARAIAGELNVNYYQVSAPELVGGVSGESESRIRSLFDSASYNAPSIIFIDEIDSIAPKRGSVGGSGGGGGRGMEQRIVAQLLTSMDSIHPKNTHNGNAVLVLGATNRPDAIDPSLRRAGRFDREIVLGAPDEVAREGILHAMTRTIRVADDVDYALLAKKTPGFVGADIRSLLKEAAVIAINRIFRTDLLGGSGGGNSGAVVYDNIVLPVGENERQIVDKNINNGGDANNDINIGESTNNNNDNFDATSLMRNDVQSIIPLTQEQLEPLYVTMSDFLLALPNVQPSSKREGFATVPDVSWSDIGALVNIREELTLSVLEPISHPERFEALGLPLPAGVLLYGPPGCGKTLLAKAIAKESGANFISVKGPELLDKYVGESERAVRVVFERARSSSPCIIFFDELDSLCPKRGSDGGSGGGGVSERVVNQLLTEMDGLDSRRSVFVIAATNRPELIDPAMLRPGRLDKLLYVPLPSSDERYSILCALSKKIKLASDVDLHTIAHNPHANGFSGADCAALLREAGLAVLRDGVLCRTDPMLDNVNKNSNDESKKEEAPLQITAHHFQYAFEHVLPSVSKKDQARYDKLRDRMARARSRGGVESTTATTAIPTESGGGDASDVESSACPPCRNK